MSTTRKTTGREQEVLELSVEGYTNEGIADHLCIDVNIVKFHKRNLYEKINVRNITKAIAFAQNNRLL